MVGGSEYFLTEAIEQSIVAHARVPITIKRHFNFISSNHSRDPILASHRDPFLDEAQATGVPVSRPNFRASSL
jgi:hypothetical protein